MKIKRGQLGWMFRLSSYIKSKAPDIDGVHCSSIYPLKDFPGVSLNFSDYKHCSPDMQDRILKAINALCNTDFEFIEDAFHDEPASGQVVSDL